MNTLELARHFIDCVERGDVDGATACHTPDSQVWHNYSNESQSIAENMELLRLMVAKCKSRKYEIHRHEEIEGGYLQHHTLHVTGLNGQSLSVEACAIVSVEQGKISRIKEWIDPTALRALLMEG
ncbi:MAG: nuclear transport factor 2 family protein [Pseudomonadota bacterium]